MKTVTIYPMQFRAPKGARNLDGKAIARACDNADNPKFMERFLPRKRRLNQVKTEDKSSA